MFIACDFCVLTFKFYVVSFTFEFCVMCFLDSDFPFRRLDKKIYSEFAYSRKENKRVQRAKNGNANNVVSYAILAHASHMQFLLKNQNTKVTNTQLKISYSKHNVTYRLPYICFGKLWSRGACQDYFSRKI